MGEQIRRPRVEGSGTKPLTVKPVVKINAQLPPGGPGMPAFLLDVMEAEPAFITCDRRLSEAAVARLKEGRRHAGDVLVLEAGLTLHVRQPGERELGAAFSAIFGDA